MKILFQIFIVSVFISGCGGGGGGGAPEVPFSLTLSSNTSFSVDEDNTLSGSVSASANESVTLNYSITSQPTQGTISLNNSGNFTYNSNADYFGSDTFTYSVTAVEKNVTRTANVNITVNPVNDAPTISLTQLAGSSDDNPYPINISSGTVEIEFNINDIDNDNSSLSIEASSDQGNVTVAYDSSLSTSSAILDITQISLAGEVDINISVSDGTDTASDVLKFWYAKKQATDDENTVFTLFGNNEDQTRKTNAVILLDSFSDNELLDALKGGLTEFVSFIGDTDLDLFTNKYFNILVIEYPIGSSSALGVETGCDDRDERIFCFEQDFIDLVKSKSQKYFSNTNSYTVITNVEGRGVANTGEKISIQSITSSDSYYVNDLILTMKHEFGHIFSDLGDEYTSDYNVRFECIDTTDLTDSECGQVDSVANTSSQTTPEALRWKHHIPDINNVNGYHDIASTNGVGMYEGSYWGTEDTFRASYDTVMNGLGSGYDNYKNSRIRSEGVQWDKIGQEAFEVKALVNQGLHDISAAFDDERNIVVSHELVVSESDYRIDWYIDGILDESLQNNSSVTITRKDSGITSAAYRIVPLGDTKIVGTDEPNIFRDFYDGVFSGYGTVYYCSSFGIESYSDVEGYDDPYCIFTARVWVTSGSSFVVNEPNVEEAMDYSNVTYLFENSGLGAQFVIKWENMP